MDVIVIEVSMFLPGRGRAIVERRVVDGAVRAARMIDPDARAGWCVGDDAVDPTLVNRWLVNHPGRPLQDRSTRWVQIAIRGAGLAAHAGRVAACATATLSADAASAAAYVTLCPEAPEWDRYVGAASLSA
jgi:hypothetical protein